MTKPLVTRPFVDPVYVLTLIQVFQAGQRHPVVLQWRKVLAQDDTRVDYWPARGSQNFLFRIHVLPPASQMWGTSPELSVDIHLCDASYVAICYK